MGFMDSLKNKAMQKMAEKFASSATGKEMMDKFMNQADGKGLEGLMNDPQMAKLADDMKNAPDMSSVTPDQIKAMLEHPMLKQLTSQLGMTPDQLATYLSTSMPQLLKQFQAKK